MTVPVRVRLRDLSIKDPARRAAIHAIVERFLDHGIFILGHELQAFEEAFAAFCGRRCAVGVASASSGLYIALRALDIGAGDEVITTPMSWLVTSNAVKLVGATPVFVDVDPNFNMDPSRIEDAVTPRTRAILPVHFYGRVCDMHDIMAVAKRRGLRVVEDVAQAAGAALDGTRAGAFGDIGVFSFSPMKVLGSMGDAGALVTDDPALADKFRMLRHCGTIGGETCYAPEIKHNMDPLHAAVVKDLLPHADVILAHRNALATRYLERLNDAVTCPDPGAGGRHTFFDFTILAPRRDALRKHLADRGIEANVRHPILICDQPVFMDLPRAAVPKARVHVERILCLPMHANLSFEDVDVVCDAINSFYARRSSDSP
jgi:dTDP-4-amino-4,6-dideoxygalactose transaminase